MFKNYLLAAWNIVLKNKLYSAINLFGLGVGLASCLLISLFVVEELSYDRHWDDDQSIYRINSSTDNNGTGEMAKFAFLPVVALPVIKEYFAGEIAYGTRVWNIRREIAVGEDRYEGNIARVDPDFMEIFKPEVIVGDLQSTVAEPTNIAISEDEALRLFGREDAIGEVISMATGARITDYRVSAVYRMPAGNSILDVPAFTVLDVSTLPENFATSWLLTGPMAFIKFREGVPENAVSSRLADFVNTHVAVRDIFQIAPDVLTSERVEYELQPIRDIHLNSEWDTFNPTGNRLAVYAFAAIAVLVLIIACVNFVILTTARTSVRGREIAMRKTLGATRIQLFGQFMGEMFVQSVLAMGIALALVEIALPLFNSFSGMSLTIEYNKPGIYGLAVVLLVATGLIGGVYPAYLLSGFIPAAVLKSSISSGEQKTVTVRSALVVFQFSISIGLLIATAVIFAQIRLGLYRDIGFNQDNLMVMDVRNSLEEAQVLREELLRLPGVINASLSFGRPPQSSTGYYGVAYYLPNTGRARMEIRTADVGEDFFETYAIDIIAGRSYDGSRDLPLVNDYSEETGELLDRNLVINEGAARLLGFAGPAQAVGETVFMPGVGVDEREMRFTIIGVAADTRFYSLRSEAPPEFYHFAPIYTRFLTVRYAGSAETITGPVQNLWQEQMGDELFNPGYVDQFLYEELGQERLEGVVLIFLAVLAILIACLGLYGLAAFTVDHRAREIGIRKVMGATIRQVVSLLLWQFSRPVLLANIVAWPLATALMLNWLQGFPYQIALWLLLPICLAAGLAALFIAWLTVGLTALKIASAKPVLALRYE